MAKDYTDFGRYCTERLRMGKSTVNRKIAVGEIFKVLASVEAKVLPSTERQMRPLLALREPDKDPGVWGKPVGEWD